MWKISLIILILTYSIPGMAQITAEEHGVENLREVFTKGDWNGNIRNYFMATLQSGELPNYWTNASGVSLKFQTPQISGFQLGLQGSITYPSATSSLRHEKDPSLDAKWERELYDVNQETTNGRITQINEMYLRFKRDSLTLTLGRQTINRGPLLNEQDGRMVPFLYEGIWGKYNTSLSKSSLGFVTGVAPRGMSGWYKLNDAIGIISTGVQPNGEASEYLGLSKTRGMMVAGHEQKYGENWKLSGWTFWLDRVFGLHWLQADYELKHFFGGIQYSFQHALPYQQKLVYVNRYYQPDETANLLALQIGTSWAGLKVKGAYSKSLRTGRFLYPRELGRDHFYTSDPRSRMDGMGDATVYKIEFNYKPRTNIPFVFVLSMQKVSPSEERASMFNKYESPPYNQLALDLKYEFSGLLKGMDVRLLYITRSRFNMESIPLAERFYHSGFHHINLVSNMKF